MSQLNIDQLTLGQEPSASGLLQVYGTSGDEVVELSSPGSTSGIVKAALQGILYGLPPIMTAAGVALGSTAHIVVGVVVASGTSTSVTFSGAAAFTSASSFVALVVDLSVATGTYISCNGVSPTGISWVSVNTHEYVYLAIGY